MKKAVTLSMLVLGLCGLFCDLSAQTTPVTTQSLSKIPLAFTKNMGQWDEQVQYRTSSDGVTIWICKDKVVYQFTRTVEDNPEVTVASGFIDSDPADQILTKRDSIQQLVIAAKFVGANADVKVVGENIREYKCNYFIGNDPTRWQSDVPNYAAVTLIGIYEGVDLRFYRGVDGSLTYQFETTSDAIDGTIQIEYEGLQSSAIDASNNTIFRTDWGDITGVLQNTSTDMILAPIEFSGLSDGKLRPDTDASSSLQRSPQAVALVFSTYLGGLNADDGFGIAVDKSHNVYVSGATSSGGFPVFNGYDLSIGGSTDAFVTKISSTGDPVFSTFLGGSAGEGSYSIAIDSDGSSYVAGNTTSSDFPIVLSFDASLSGGSDAFVAKLSVNGDSLLYSSYLGGAGGDEAWGVAVDSGGSAYIVGATSSSDFPIENALFTSLSGGSDAFVSKISPTGGNFVFSTFLGGTGSVGEDAFSVAVDQSGDAYVTGRTSSPDFPMVNSFQSAFGGGSFDGFASRFSSDGMSLVYSTYLGGSAQDYGRGVAIDQNSNAYLIGESQSADFPLMNAFDSTSAKGAVVIKYSPTGSMLFSTFLAGSLAESGRAIAVDAAGSAYVTGVTYSADFPLLDAFDTALSGSNDAFVTKFSPSGASLIYSSFLGGNGIDGGFAIAVDDSGSAYVTGETESGNFPTTDAFDSTYGGFKDAFIAKIAPNELPNPSFGNGTRYPLPGVSSTDIAIADIDGQGGNDLIVGADGVAVARNQGGGTFGPIERFGSGIGGWVQVVCGDIDGDNDIDIVASGSANIIRVYANDGDGIFSERQSISASGFVTDLLLPNIDADSDLDIAATLDGSGILQLYRNNGAGFFGAPENLSVGSRPWAITSGDLNNDGLVDLVTANESAHNASVLINAGGGSFAPAVNYALGAAGSSPRGICCGDFNRDGDTDIAAVTASSSKLMVLLNSGDGTLLPAIEYPIGYNSNDMLTDDFDGDNDMDIAVPSYFESNVWVYTNAGNGSFTSEGTYATCSYAIAIASGDLDGQGMSDLAFALQENGVCVLLSNSQNNSCSAPVMQDDFTDGNDDGWRGNPEGTWTVSNGLFEASLAVPDPITWRFTGNTSWADMCLSFDLKNVQSRETLIYLRWGQGGTNGYLCMIKPNNGNPALSNLEMLKYVNNGVVQRVTYPIVTQLNQWYHFDFELIGGTITCKIDGADAFTYSDPQNSWPNGRFGLGIQKEAGIGQSQVQFDNVTVRCASAESCLPYANVSGSVVNAANNQPLQGVLVEFLQNSQVQYSKISDNNGLFEVLGINQGTYDVRFVKNGFNTHTASVNFASLETELQEVILVPEGFISTAELKVALDDLNVACKNYLLSNSFMAWEANNLVFQELNHAPNENKREYLIDLLQAVAIGASEEANIEALKLVVKTAAESDGLTPYLQKVLFEIQKADANMTLDELLAEAILGSAPTLSYFRNTVRLNDAHLSVQQAVDGMTNIELPLVVDSRIPIAAIINSVRTVEADIKASTYCCPASIAGKFERTGLWNLPGQCDISTAANYTIGSDAQHAMQFYSALDRLFDAEEWDIYHQSLCSGSASSLAFRGKVASLLIGIPLLVAGGSGALIIGVYEAAYSAYGGTCALLGNKALTVKMLSVEKVGQALLSFNASWPDALNRIVTLRTEVFGDIEQLIENPGVDNCSHQFSVSSISVPDKLCAGLITQYADFEPTITLQNESSDKSGSAKLFCELYAVGKNGFLGHLRTDSSATVTLSPNSSSDFRIPLRINANALLFEHDRYKIVFKVVTSGGVLTESRTFSCLYDYQCNVQAFVDHSVTSTKGFLKEGGTKVINFASGVGAKMNEFTLFWPGSDMDLHVWDAAGRHVGRDSTTGEIDMEIPGAWYSGPDSYPERIIIPDPVGELHLQVNGVSIVDSEFFSVEAYEEFDHVAVLLPTIPAVYLMGVPGDSVAFRFLLREMGGHNPASDIALTWEILQSPTGDSIPEFSASLLDTILPPGGTGACSGYVNISPSAEAGWYSGVLNFTFAGGEFSLPVSLELRLPRTCGDADANGLVTISDAVYLINYIFAGGPAPVPRSSGDSDCNDITNISDVVYLINYIFGGGPTPCSSC